MGLMEPTNHPNANNSRWLALGNIVFFLLGLALPWITNHTVIYSSTGFIVSEVILLGASAASVVIGVKNTFETNEDWKSIVMYGTLLASMVVPLTFIVSLTNKIV